MREPKLYSRPLAPLAPDLNGAAGLSHEALHHREPQARATAYLLGCEEWVECPRESCLIHPHTGINDRQDNVIAG
ncbi:MAG TPA: hypothetical protein VN203_15555, partial [Candidatus Acidoferrum sp.]|nr:hypothetical protein [Candidatus Acidoferrum sp.]